MGNWRELCNLGWDVLLSLFDFEVYKDLNGKSPKEMSKGDFYGRELIRVGSFVENRN